MYVKDLTLRGFKSFASATDLRFEPGITCVVGPNGSGKSNIVDAFAWVMGEQGVKTLRGGKMEDVVFAGTASRPPLGRAEVTLTIDNTDGALPIDYTEVTIRRLLFRSGQSEYAINGNHCRLLDIAELLSDSGLGREMHVVVGQGQLDQVLHAGPEARRALIEEAAGVLKHRRRKEKALRKLEAMQTNLTRLVDLTAEVRRRLGPLGRQAAIARRAAAIQADLRDARLRLLADDYVSGSRELARGEADEAAVLARRAELERALAGSRRRESALDADEAEHAPRLARAQETWFALSAMAERLRGVGNLARERHSHLAAEPGPQRPGRNPDELDAEAAALREQEAALGDRLEAASARLASATGLRESAETVLAEAERQLKAQARATAERAERLARLRGQVGAARSRVSASEEEAARLADALEQARSRARVAQQEFEDYQDVASGRQDDHAGLAAEHERVAAHLAECSARVADLRAAERRASAERAALLARTEALEEGIRAIQQGADGSAALLADPQWSGDVLGAVAGLLTVADGAQEAITAALGGAADAVAVVGLDAAVAIIQAFKDADGGSARLVIAGEGAGLDGPVAVGNAAGRNPGGASPAVPRPGVFSGHDQARDLRADGKLPAGVMPAADLVTGPEELSPALGDLLAGVVVADDLGQARDLVRAHPGLRAVTRDGDLVGAHWAHGGSARPPSKLAMRAAADEAAARLAAAGRVGQAAAEALAQAAVGEESAREAVKRALAGLQAADKAAADFSGRLGRLAGAARAAGEEAARLAEAIGSAQAQHGRDQAKLAELTARLEEAEAGEAASADSGAPASQPAAGPAEESEEPDRDALAEAAAAAREAEMDARLEVRTAEERLRAIAGRADVLATAAVSERRAAQAALVRRQRREQQAGVARAVARGADLALERIAESLGIAAAEREAAEVASKGRAEALKQVRAQVREFAAELDTVVDTAHGAEIARAERRMKLEQAAERAAEEFGVEVAVLVAEYGPDVLIPVPEEADDGKGKGAGRAGKRAVAANGGGVTGGGIAGPASNGAVAEDIIPQAGGGVPLVGGGVPLVGGSVPAARDGNGTTDGDGLVRDGSVPPAHDESIPVARDQGSPVARDGYGAAPPGNRAAAAGDGAANEIPAVAGGRWASAGSAAAGGSASAGGNRAAADGNPAAVDGGGAANGTSAVAGESSAADRSAAAGGSASAGGNRAAADGRGEGRPAGGGDSAGAGNAPVRLKPYVRAEQEKRAATAQRQLDQLGKVNPLALEEYAALEERHAFLANQVEDLKKTRRDLLTVIKEVDDRVQQVFASAFADTASEFEQIFTRLFPGGEGRLVLTEPDDMLATGIDVEARPAGKKVKRLSLLSGGERSLTAIAYLLAIFKARPSPFYVLDEVEAALDDINLQRLLAIFEELRDTSQLIIVTHQKRTMEVADALYGISMRGDGVSAVVSQRLRERERA